MYICVYVFVQESIRCFGCQRTWRHQWTSSPSPSASFYTRNFALSNSEGQQQRSAAPVHDALGQQQFAVPHHAPREFPDDRVMDLQDSGCKAPGKVRGRTHTSTLSSTLSPWGRSGLSTTNTRAQFHVAGAASPCAVNYGSSTNSTRDMERGRGGAAAPRVRHAQC